MSLNAYTTFDYLESRVAACNGGIPYMIWADLTLPKATVTENIGMIFIITGTKRSGKA